MKDPKLILIVPIAIVLIAISEAIFGGKKEGIDIPNSSDVHKAVNSVYYWRTTFTISQYESDFLKNHKIGRLYVRMFDVIKGETFPEPNATIKFITKPDSNIEIIPTLFITVEAIKQAAEKKEGITMLADKIVKRVNAMCSWNEINNWKEIQLDCDWNATTREHFFNLCYDVKKSLGKDKLLSSTIRLHQLQQEAPPVDYGVLMIYNTDDFSNYDTNNSILNNNTVEAYLCKEQKCRIPLDIALPIFQWDIFFKDGKFERIARKYEQADSMEEIRHEQVPFSELRKTQELANKYLHLSRGKHSIILYHLDETNLMKYGNEEFESLYNN